MGSEMCIRDRLSPVFFRCERAPLGRTEIRTQLSADPGARPGSMMRVVCDNCGAVYKISESKLVKEVNRATCKRCGHKILIARPGSAPPASSASVSSESWVRISVLPSGARSHRKNTGLSGRQFLVKRLSKVNKFGPNIEVDLPQ